jgi:Na+/H+ antiporter NhaD/arsenite permease-like protein
MIPALLILKARGAALGVTEPWQFFWATGVLSSFLDNAPTYLTFLSLAQGLGANPEVVGIPARVLMGISLGAVFMGANTYIGNAPNFMVKSIAEENAVKMPSFFGYFIYSVIVLVPTFLVVTYLFLR